MIISSESDHLHLFYIHHFTFYIQYLSYSCTLDTNNQNNNSVLSIVSGDFFSIFQKVRKTGGSPLLGGFGVNYR